MERWRTFEREEVCKGFIFSYEKVERQSPTTGKKAKFDILKTSDWVNMIPLTEDNEVVMVKQYRHGSDSITLEIPGGALGKGEPFQEAAERELQEETGYAGDEWIKIGQVEPNPAFMQNICETYLVKNCERICEQNLDPFEEIDVELVPLEDIPRLIKEGKIQHSLVIAAFYHLDNFRS